MFFSLLTEWAEQILSQIGEIFSFRLLSFWVMENEDLQADLNFKIFLGREGGGGLGGFSKLNLLGRLH